MTKLSYRLYDGTLTTSYVKALASGKPFSRVFEAIPNIFTDEKRRKKILEKYGYMG